MALGKQLTHKNLLLAYLETAANHGISVAEHPSFGGVHPVHVNGSWHYDGLAADLNTAPGASAAEKNALKPWGDRAIALGIGYFLNYSGRGIGAAATHNDHMHVDAGGFWNFGNGDLAVPANPGYPIIHQNVQGVYVEILQRVLKLYGFDPGPIDGDDGPKTTAAVEAYQTDRHLTVDGWAGAQTWGQIRKP